MCNASVELKIEFLPNLRFFTTRNIALDLQEIEPNFQGTEGVVNGT